MRSCFHAQGEDARFVCRPAGCCFCGVVFLTSRFLPWLFRPIRAAPKKKIQHAASTVRHRVHERRTVALDVDTLATTEPGQATRD